MSVHDLTDRNRPVLYIHVTNQMNRLYDWFECSQSKSKSHEGLKRNNARTCTLPAHSIRNNARPLELGLKPFIALQWAEYNGGDERQ